jgi:beta-glucuronidase
LWSPEDANLYELRAQVKTANALDRWRCRTGFREIKTQGRIFLLNGKRLVMSGVCRHDTWKDQGFTLSRRQQEQDMRMIKAMGCNFVRLVHYPHDRRIVELADELGLLISEEQVSGTWILTRCQRRKSTSAAGSWKAQFVETGILLPSACGCWGMNARFRQLSQTRQGDLRQIGPHSSAGLGGAHQRQG